MKFRLLILLISASLLLAACSGGASSSEPATTTSTSSTRASTSTSLTATPTAPPSTAASPTEPPSVTVTIPEGYTTMQIAAALEKNGVCSKAEFVNTAQNYAVQSFNVPQSSSRCFRYEGYLFPDTYTFYLADDPVNVLRKFPNNYAARSGMPTDDTLIIASIVEQEARSDENMRLVASVLYNRLNNGMKLECDSTRAYVNNHITGNPLVADPGQYAALYNTYKCAARPAGPICNPSSRAIAATRNPSATNYFYYFFGNDNQNHYSATYEEHQAQIAQYGVQYS